MSTEFHLEQVKLILFPATKVAALEFRGTANDIDLAINKFIAWRKHNHLHPSISKTFNIFYASDVDNDTYHFDICASIDHELPENDLGISSKIIPGGRCAVLQIIGGDADLPVALSYLATRWLPQSGETIGDFPMFCQRVKFFPEVPEQQSIIDVFLPLKD